MGGLHTVIYWRNWVYTVVRCLLCESRADQTDSPELMSYKLTRSSLRKEKVVKPLHLISSPTVPSYRKRREGPRVVSMAGEVGRGLWWRASLLWRNALNIPWHRTNSLLSLNSTLSICHVLYSCLSRGSMEAGQTPA